MDAPKRVLFVCIENSNQSQMAEAFARLVGSDRIEAYGAGSRPSGRVNPRRPGLVGEVEGRPPGDLYAVSLLPYL